MNVYNKINTLYKRYVIDKDMSDTIPNKDWLKFNHKIIIGDFSNQTFDYIKNLPMEAFEKIDGTNSKIAFYPSTGEYKVCGKTDKAESQSGQFEYLSNIAEKILPKLKEMFPKECAIFRPIKDSTNNFIFYDKVLDDNLKFNGWQNIENDELTNGIYGIKVEEDPIYIYGEYYGKGIHKVGKKYLNGNDFIVFDIQQQGWWLPTDLRNELCNKLGLNQVPYLGEMSLLEAEKIVQEGFKTHLKAVDSNLLSEGIVLRSSHGLKDSSNNRLMVKIKHIDYEEYNRVRKQFSNDEFEKFNNWYFSHKIK